MRGEGALSAERWALRGWRVGGSALVACLAIPVAGGRLSPQSEPLRLATQPTLVVGAAPEAGSELGDVVAATRLSNGSIAVADRGLFEVRVYDRQGRLVGRTGRRGQGPGDFGSVQRMWRGRADSLFVYDQIHGRVSVLDARARYVRSWPPLGAAPMLYVVGSFADGSLLGEVQVRTSPPPRTQAHVGEKWLLVVSPEGRRTDTLPRRFSREEVLVVVTGGRVTGGAKVPLGCIGHVAVHEGAIYYGDGCGARIQQLDRRGNVEREFVLPEQAQVLRPRERDSVVAAFTRDPRMPPNFRDELRAEFRKALTDRRVSAFDSLLVDALGRPWVRTTRSFNAREREWIVFAPQGDLMSRVRVPVGWSLLEIGRDYLLLTGTDADGLTVVQEHRLEGVS